MALSLQQSSAIGFGPVLSSRALQAALQLNGHFPSRGRRLSLLPKSHTQQKQLQRAAWKKGPQPPHLCEPYGHASARATAQ